MTSPQVALVTGGNRGIGLAIARQLGARGIRVVLTARRAADGEAAVAQLKAGGADAHWLPLDVADEASRQQAAAQLLQTHGQIGRAHV
jgi:NAD(P)-dependent dehydrogenase (short-subunit alcohol dehydrogenase family)